MTDEYDYEVSEELDGLHLRIADCESDLADLMDQLTKAKDVLWALRALIMAKRPRVSDLRAFIESEADDILDDNSGI